MLLILASAILLLVASAIGTFILSKKSKLLKDSVAAYQQEIATLKKSLSLKQAESDKNDQEIQFSMEQLRAEQQIVESEKKKIEEKNKKIWKMSEAALKESHRLEELNVTLQSEKEKLETEKKKLDEKVKKLWQTSLSIHKEKERISELNDLLALEKSKSESLLADIQRKNKEITDNINYAQRIQSAILPDVRLIHQALEQSFILYQPKDIVSGDFYAFAESNNHVIIIAGDCTGHGVSGAFMSMIGSSLINEIINEKGIIQPAHILNHLNIGVIEALKQSENESIADGMDISICSFDIRNSELQYSGANRPLWIIRNDDIRAIAPDKFPIGGLQSARDRQFTNHVIQLQENDAVYIFTDGYADQFGGEKGKKLMTAKFKKILLSIQHLSMPEQDKFLRNYFEEWKGENEQVDDLLVIGVKI